MSDANTGKPHGKGQGSGKARANSWLQIAGIRDRISPLGRRFNMFVAFSLVALAVVPTVLVGIVALKDARDLGYTAISDAREMGEMAVQENRDALLEMAANQLHSQSVILSERLSEAMDVRFNDIVALSAEEPDQLTYRRFLELHIGKVHNLHDKRTGDVETHVNDMELKPVYKHVLLIDRTGHVAIQASASDSYLPAQREMKVFQVAPDAFPLELLQQCYSMIATSPIQFKGKIYIASATAIANDGRPRRTNLIAKPLDHNDGTTRFQEGSLVCATPVFDDTEFRGVMVVDIDWLHLMKLVNDFRFGQYGYAYLQESTGEVSDLSQSANDYAVSNILPDGTAIDYGQVIENARLGLVIAHPQHNYVGWMDLTVLGIPNLTCLSSIQNSLGSGIYKCNHDNFPRWTAYTPVQFPRERIVNLNNWSVAATLPTYEFIQPATVTGEHIQARIDMAAARIKTRTESLGAENVIILTAAIVAFISIGLAVFLSRRIQKDAKLKMEMAAVEVTNIKLEHLAAECREAELEAKKERDRAQTYFDVAGVIMLVLDVEGMIQRINRSGQQLLGFSEHDLRGRDWYVVAVPAKVRDKGRRFFKGILHNAGSGYEASESQVISANGAERIISWHTKVLFDEGGAIYGVLGSGEDITEKRESESRRKELEQKALVSSRLASVGEMASGIAHEINNPLTAVIGFSQMLMEREDLPEDIRQDLKIIHEGSERVSNIVTRLLAFARQHKPRRDYVDVNEIINTTINMRKYYLANNNIKLVTKLDPSLPVTVADGGQLQQVILNLIINAETAMTSTHGRGTLAVSTWSNDGIICISVRDDGPGIEPDIISKIFDPFFTTREVGKGTGLGLSICHGIVSEHKGKIHVNSDKGKGAEFTVEIPVESAAPVLPDEVKPQAGTEATTGRRILVVDDEPGVRDFLSQLLSRHRYQVEMAADADSAYELVQRGDFDLILTDIKMPGLSGIDLARKIKIDDYRLAERIIFMSGDVMEPYIQRFAVEENAVIVTKPFDIKALLSLIEGVRARKVLAMVENGKL